MSHAESSLNYPLDIRRRIDRKWQRRAAASVQRARRPRPSRVEHLGCVLCHASAPIAPVALIYRGAGLIHHQWLCVPCGHVWMTAVRMPE